MATEVQHTAIIMKHERLIQELETKYLDQINELLKEKASLHQKLQRILYAELQRFSNSTKQCDINQDSEHMTIDDVLDMDTHTDTSVTHADIDISNTTNEEDHTLQDTTCAMLCNTTISMYLSDDSEPNTVTKSDKNEANDNQSAMTSNTPIMQTDVIMNEANSIESNDTNLDETETETETETEAIPHETEAMTETNSSNTSDQNMATIKDTTDSTDRETCALDQQEKSNHKVRPRSFTTRSKIANKKSKTPPKKRKRRPQFKSLNKPVAQGENAKKTADMLKNQGNQLLKQKKYKDAIAKYTAAIELDGANAIYFSNRAAVLTYLTLYDESIADAQMASSIDPNYVKAYVREAYAEYKLNHFQKARDAYAKALGLTAENHPDYQMYTKQIKLCQGKLKQTTKPRTGGKPLRSSQRYKCHLCHKKLLTKLGLKYHYINKHTPNEEKPFICMYCDFGTCTNWALERHISTHIDEEGNLKPVLCKQCGETFTNKVAFTRHVNTHKTMLIQEDKPFKCSRCEYKASSKKTLEQHQATHKGEKAFRCHVCGKQFVDAKHLMKHKTTHSLMSAE
eukprot:703522_1